jgi:hypothetical protein
VALLVFSVEGFHGIALWNAAPLALAAGGIALSGGDLASRELRAGGFVFWASQVVFVALLHIGWHLDWGAMATGSSTAGLIFLVAPVYTVGAGLALAVLTIVFLLD